MRISFSIVSTVMDMVAVKEGCNTVTLRDVFYSKAEQDMIKAQRSNSFTLDQSNPMKDISQIPA